MADIVFRSNRKDIEKAVKNAVDIVMEAIAQQAEGNAIREVTALVYDTPPSPNYIRTGDLRKSIAHKYVPEEKTAYIGSAIEYAPYVEYGTRNMHERPFLRNAIMNHKAQYKALFEEGIKKLS